MRYFPKAKHDDGPDALQIVVRCCQEIKKETTIWLPLEGGDDEIREMLKDNPGLQAEFDKAKEEEKKQYPYTGDPNKKYYGKQYDDTDDGEDD